ncbi:GNAT family N-acetyltransferase [Halochromatium glycolicum]|uniref:GNAT family N-acetyltransferase n=1 Tax=Halochromatium glycolicum TaxID=85075 RepID=A0AAJ0XAS2_9GAMM|nr:GNAT family N-acetyltransferase [Halochromatium glycolicum]MBK1705142.1 GNAT family N-acetyltransferase [Halochromatium glycolicum]
MYQLRVHPSIAEIPGTAWDALAGDDLPHLCHAFLLAMERHGCVGERFGWLPRHLALYDQDEQLVAAAPAYLKFNSYGEFVFDWAWADAYQRAGLRYYPKLVIASPYTPATGQRVLTGDAPNRAELASALVRGSVKVANELDVSGVHWLFSSEEEVDWMREAGLMARLGCQFHWTNQGYADFDALLASFSAEKRKKIKRERRRVTEAGVRIRRVPGNAASDAEWAVFHRLYEDTFDKRGGIPTLSLSFFREIGETMGESTLLVLAEHGGEIVAAAFCLVGARSLYGRHWGCSKEFHSLHFEACYYQGLEHCIEQGLQRFEPGAQGEHKVARGFMPTRTWSTHWLAEPAFREPISHFLAHEIDAVEEYIGEMAARSPYRQADPVTSKAAERSDASSARARG